MSGGNASSLLKAAGEARAGPVRPRAARVTRSLKEGMRSSLVGYLLYDDFAGRSSACHGCSTACRSLPCKAQALRSGAPGALPAFEAEFLEAGEPLLGRR